MEFSQIPEPLTETSASTMMPFCQWNGCGILLQDNAAGGCTRHLKDFHLQPWNGTMTARCLWLVHRPAPPPGIPPPPHHNFCYRQIKYANFGKHIASVHFRSTVRFCPDCHASFSRRDALRRHEASGVCPGPNQAGGVPQQ
ncbi:uncharacterized protein LAESUDRAFT_578296 [Laetiporus sulphureus 93-53]|uniref:C2H2-type domain-containing protein n=1 Tax=Laetiporus sulphureus 93-53 TaxID=1314785 RepID=A0A165B0B7_9APHY|nr:uncharacterized protein LAESUDRAFT_578296 [Laetiporus sulphureus 93-53]KZS99989.1 hypothetical protein LAESUDRAFT_578296 [Laetiporus sulphureus 93-53]